LNPRCATSSCSGRRELPVGGNSQSKSWCCFSIGESQCTFRNLPAGASLTPLDELQPPPRQLWLCHLWPDSSTLFHGLNELRASCRVSLRLESVNGPSPLPFSPIWWRMIVLSWRLVCEESPTT
jgi:hypothetical protein